MLEEPIVDAFWTTFRTDSHVIQIAADESTFALLSQNPDALKLEIKELL